MIRLSKIDTTCAAARLLEQGMDPDDLDKIRTETGCTKRQAEKISENMKDQISFLRWLERLDRELRA